MNKHKEALHKIVKITKNIQIISKSCAEIFIIATEALQSESEIDFDYERIKLKVGVVISNTIMSGNEKVEAIMKLLQPKSESRMYNQYTDFEEWAKRFYVELSIGTWTDKDQRPRLIFYTTNELKEKFQSIQPKTEEVERGWTITDRTVIDKQLEAIKTVMGTIKTKEQAIQFLKDSGIEFEEQPTSPSIEKIIEKHFIKNRVYLTSNETHTIKDIIEEILSYKANNNFDELEKWVNESKHFFPTSVEIELLKKIQELKTKLQN